jgi:hypothetical protein
MNLVTRKQLAAALGLKPSALWNLLKKDGPKPKGRNGHFDLYDLEESKQWYAPRAAKKAAMDITGQQIGEWRVLRLFQPGGYNEQTYECRCSCSRIKIVKGWRLKLGVSTHCGCQKRRNMAEAQKGKRPGPRTDLTGQKFGRLLVIGLSDKRDPTNYPLWICKCDCGNESLCTSGNLRYKHTLSCGCLRKEAIDSRKHDLKGSSAGYLTYLSEAGINKKTRGRMINCSCACGNQTTIPADQYMSGHTKSCGCLGAEMRVLAVKKDIKGQRFGHLVVLRESVNHTNKRCTYWECRCDCGTVWDVAGTSLRRKTDPTISCGCRRKKKIKNVPAGVAPWSV